MKAVIQRDVVFNETVFNHSDAAEDAKIRDTVEVEVDSNTPLVQKFKINVPRDKDDFLSGMDKISLLTHLLKMYIMLYIM